jgi:hypothetical protein
MSVAAGSVRNMARQEPTGDLQLAELARSMRADGATYAEIKGALGIGSSTLGRLLGTLGQGRPKPRISPNVREQARKLRQDGSTVPEIADKLGVARSTAWLMVRDIQPAPGFSARERRAEAGRAYWREERPRRAAAREQAVADAASQVASLTARELMLVGAVAYWAEGSKSKPWRTQDRLTFINSDPDMIKLFLAWLGQAGVMPDRVRYRVNIHESADVNGAVQYWADVVGVASDSFQKTTLKQHSPLTQRHNAGSDYHGCLVVRVNSSAKEYRLAEGLWKGLSAAVEGMPGPKPAS